MNKRFFVIAGLFCLAFDHHSWAQRPNKFLCIDALHRQPTVLIDRAQLACTAVPAIDQFLDRREGFELHVFNRRFLSDYTVEITGVTTPQSAVIRGIEEAANLTLGAPSLIPPPAKGGVSALSPTDSATILQQLLDETQMTKPAAELEAEYQELQRERNQLDHDLGAAQTQYNLVMKARPVRECTTLGGAPNLEDVSSCLRDELRHDQTGIWDLGLPSYGDEEQFRLINVSAKYLLDTMVALQAVIQRSNLDPSLVSVESDLSQFEKNLDTFQANTQAMRAAIQLYRGFQRDLEARTELKRDQLRLLFKNRLGSVVDDAELNRLVEAVLSSLGNFRVADNEMSRLEAGLDQKQPLATRATMTEKLRSDLNNLEANNKNTLPNKIGEVNGLQSQLVERINAIYDHSAVPQPLVKQIDLSAYSGNLIVYYKLHRVETFARYQIVTPVIGSGATTTSSSQPAVALTPATTPTPTTATATAFTSTPTSYTSASPPPPGDVVVSGQFEVHEFDRATVVAGFAFSLMHNNSFKAQPTTTNGTTTYTAVVTSQPFQPHVLIGVDYYFRPRDTFPTIAKGYHARLSDFGVLGGLSANSLNNYFLGAAWEPSLGFNFGVGAHFGTETRLLGPVPLTSNSVPTYDKRLTKLFFMAGFDLQIFRKIFGKVTGVGASATSTGGS